MTTATPGIYIREIPTNTDLSNTDLSNTDMSNRDLGVVEMQGANLSGANLCGANLSLARGLDTADLHTAKYNNATLWPEGFDPAAQGAVLVG